MSLRDRAALFAVTGLVAFIANADLLKTPGGRTEWRNCWFTFGGYELPKEPSAMEISDLVFVADAERKPDIPAPRVWGNGSLGFQRVVLGLHGVSRKNECSNFITSSVNCSRRGCGDNFIAINYPAKICEGEWGSFIAQHQAWTNRESTDRWSGASVSQSVRNGDVGAVTIENERTLSAYTPRDAHPRAMGYGELLFAVFKGLVGYIRGSCRRFSRLLSSRALLLDGFESEECDDDIDGSNHANDIFPMRHKRFRFVLGVLFCGLACVCFSRSADICIDGGRWWLWLAWLIGGFPLFMVGFGFILRVY